MRTFNITIARAITSVLIIIAGWRLGQGLLDMSHGGLREGLTESLLSAGVIVILILGWRLANTAACSPRTGRKDNLDKRNDTPESLLFTSEHEQDRTDIHSLGQAARRQNDDFHDHVSAQRQDESLKRLPRNGA